MSSTSPMIVALRELPARRRVEVSSELVRETLAGMPMRDALERPADDPAAGAGQADLSIYEEEGNVFVRGPLTGWVEVACSRCLGPARVSLDEDLGVTFLPRARLAGDEAGAGDDDEAAPARPQGKDGAKDVGEDGGEGDAELGVELSGDDLDVYGYEGEEIDLTPLFREQIILAVPFAPLCSEECRGLCPQCGADRNQETCDCKPPVDPRWAALQNLKP